ncbi:TonB-dependent receptor [Pseudogemmatithrix spongiicola]|uniref:TonB-dependent receptor n=1 Tax=Pseudogemmatithrix spongiicola TaxID=3062599 RepID=A0AA49K250_9BACT|nr:TonB-dependent receptor [Gemmatimonadaceae bacterium 'strain 138']WKW16402.1 TonB-dependent receptor [Gemmatimonadaceae bacterium 'strain 318']
MRLLLALLALPLATALAQPSGTITGTVVATGTEQPIAGAQLVVEGADRRAVADDQGRFVILGVAPGVWRLQVRAIGYRPVIIPDVVVGSGKPTTLAIRLLPAPIDVAAVEVRAAYFTPAVEGTTSTQTLTAEAIRRAPGVQEDVVRAVALLPGVGVTQPGRNDLVVRGGAPFENLFLVDGIEVPNINHFGTQGSTGGPLSLINVDAVEQASFSAGGFAAKYGDRTASVTSITLREGNRRQFGGEFNISATGGFAIAEGPLGERGSFYVSARRSYLDLLFKAAGFGFVPAYSDLQVKAVQDLGTRDKLSFLFIGADGTVTFFNDDEDQRYDNSRVAAPTQQQYFSGLTWRRLVPRGILDLTLGRTWTSFQTIQNDSLNPPNTIFRAFSTEGEQSLRADLTLQTSTRTELNVGAVARYASDLSYDLLLPGPLRTDATGAPQPLSVDTSFTADRQALYGSIAYQATPKLRATLGLRGDRYGFLEGTLRASPRLGLRYALNDRTALTASAGRYWQTPSFIWLVGDPSNAQLDPFRADQAVAGIEHLLRDDVKLQFEVYAKGYAQYPRRLFRPQAVLSPSGFDDVTSDIPFGLEPLAATAKGRSIGAELFVQKQLSEIPLFGLASVSVARTTFDGADGVARPGSFDTRAIGNAVLGWRPNAKWELSGKFRIASGLPTTPFITTGADAGRQDFSQWNEGERLPVFHALDVRVDRRWSLRSVQLVGYLDIQNVYSRENVSGLQWDQRERTVLRNTSIGLLPSIGFSIDF